MSREHKEWTDEERKAEARFTHAFNRLAKIDSVILEHKHEIASLKVERKRLREIVE